MRTQIALPTAGCSGIWQSLSLLFSRILVGGGHASNSPHFLLKEIIICDLRVPWVFPLFCRMTMKSAYSLDVRTSQVARRWTAQRRARGDSPYSRRDALPSQLLGRGTVAFSAPCDERPCKGVDLEGGGLA